MNHISPRVWLSSLCWRNPSLPSISLHRSYFWFRMSLNMYAHPHRQRFNNIQKMPTHKTKDLGDDPSILLMFFKQEPRRIKFPPQTMLDTYHRRLSWCWAESWVALYSAIRSFIILSVSFPIITPNTVKFWIYFCTRHESTIRSKDATWKVVLFDNSSPLLIIGISKYVLKDEY